MSLAREDAEMLSPEANFLTGRRYIRWIPEKHVNIAIDAPSHCPKQVTGNGINGCNIVGG